MKRLVALIATLALVVGCTTPLPKPTNADGSFNASAAVSDADLTYQDAATNATAYVTQCHAIPSTPGCSESLITGLKQASTKAKAALKAAHDALKAQPGVGSGIDKAIADLNAALIFLQSFVGQIPQNLRAK